MHNFLSHLLGPGVFPPLLVTLKFRFVDSRSRREAPTHTPVFHYCSLLDQGGLPFDFELRLLGLVFGLMLGLAGVRFASITLNLRASQLIDLQCRKWRQPIWHVQAGRLNAELT